MTIANPVDPRLHDVPQRTVAQIIDSLASSTLSRMPRAAVAEVVSQCLADLQPVRADALPEMLERLARQRLAYLLDPSAWRG